MALSCSRSLSGELTATLTEYLTAPGIPMYCLPAGWIASKLAGVEAALEIEGAVIAGPDTGLRVPLVTGRQIAGRGQHCMLRLTDPLLEPHHLAIDVSPDGSVDVKQLAGRFSVETRRAVPPHTGRFVRAGGSCLFLGRRLDMPRHPPEAPVVRISHSRRLLDESLRTAADRYRSQQWWLSRYHPGQRMIGLGTERAAVEVVDEQGSPLTASELDFAGQAILDTGLQVDDAPVLARLDVAIAVHGRDDRIRFEVEHRLRALGLSIVDVPGAAQLELGDRWRAWWTDRRLRSERRLIHLSLPPVPSGRSSVDR